MHVIRLRGPWELSRDEDAPGQWLRVEVPGNVGAALAEDYRGPVRLVRRFNSPTNLEGERVHLCCLALPSGAELTVNGRPLPCPAGGVPLREEITALLLPHNRIELRFELPSPALGEVRLEITSA